MPRQRHKIAFILSALLILMVILSACAPQIYGVRKHRKDRNCGCEYKLPVTEPAAAAQI